LIFNFANRKEGLVFHRSVLKMKYFMYVNEEKLIIF